MKQKQTDKIAKLIVKAEDIATSFGWSLEDNPNLILCPYCLSPLHYVKINWGIVVEDNFYQVMGNRDKRVYALREIGFSIYCAECGEFIEHYDKYFYPEDKVIDDFRLLDELDIDERAEIINCLTQFNQSGNFQARIKSSLFATLKQKLIEYEKKHPIKVKEILKEKLKKKL